MEIRYEGTVVAEQISRRLWRLHEPLRLLFGGSKIVVPSGFVSDGASIPRILWPVIGHPMQFRAAWIHDWLYQRGSVSRKCADGVFYHALVSDGISKAKAWVMWRGVRIGGAGVWSNYRGIIADPVKERDGEVGDSTP